MIPEAPLAFVVRASAVSLHALQLLDRIRGTENDGP